MLYSVLTECDLLVAVHGKHKLQSEHGIGDNQWGKYVKEEVQPTTPDDKVKCHINVRILTTGILYGAPLGSHVHQYPFAVMLIGGNVCGIGFL